MDSCGVYEQVIDNQDSKKCEHRACVHLAMCLINMSF